MHMNLIRNIKFMFNDRNCHRGQKKKKGPTVCCLQEIYFKYKDTHRVKVN